MRRLLLDHLTAAEATPAELIEIAALGGCDGVGLLAAPLQAYPETAGCDLAHDAAALRATCVARDATGVGVDWVYPFFLSPQRTAQVLAPLLDIAATLGAHGAGVIIYDAEPARRADKLAQLGAMARARGLKLSLEFLPASRVCDVDAALDVLARVGDPEIGLTIDILHLLRSGGALHDLARVPPQMIALAQICDGPLAPPVDIFAESKDGRLYPGEGAFPLADFIKRMPADVTVGVEAPATRARGDARTRALAAIAAAKTVLAF
ncbi:MAG: sugar phosphate isomerase/epimerase [Hyphomonadaceae bacterium JAD_PAG50586_4]|nr:MAG: sugar phosphate isomerase/epimerase [Hyphomonadaceae bacterium JAD_PAG50586_4]